MIDAPTPSPVPIAVLGSGSWGTALAVQLARSGQPVTLWGRNAAELQTLGAARTNRRYLPGVILPECLRVDPDLKAVVRTHSNLLICVPSHAFRSLLTTIRGNLAEGARVAWAALHRARGVPVAVLSGPTFAREVGAGLPTAMTVAASSPAFATELAARLSHHNFRAYTSRDIIGVEVGGAVKNVLAIAAGISDGLGFGANTRIALITRGLAEMTALGVALGARTVTFMGLSGMGDLVLTCTDNQSRNRRFGLALASGKPAQEAARDIGQVVEGQFAATAVHTVAKRRNVEMPICEQVYLVLTEQLPPREAAMALLARGLGPEND
jgi:glycerol-3-phosphate dehydrogenase (NAD(P)+)